MPFEQRGAFRVFRDVDIPDLLVLETHRLDDCLKEVREKPYHGVVITEPNGFREPTIGCLEKIPHLTAVWIWDIHLRELSGLYGLPNLAYLRLTDDHGPVDFSRLASIETLVLQYGRKDRGTDALDRCRTLYLWRFQPKSRNWIDFAFPAALESLHVYWANPSDLEGWPSLPKLRTLEFGRCRNLSNLGRLPEIAPNLERLLISACGRATDLPVDCLEKLRFAMVNGVRLKG